MQILEGAVAPATPFNGGTINVLIVDDSALMRTVIKRVLGASGVPVGDVREAGDGAAALAALDEHPIDLAVLDINMPVLSGLEVLERVRANPALASLRVLVASSDGTDARLSTLQGKSAGFIEKPFTPEELRDKILQLTGGST